MRNSQEDNKSLIEIFEETTIAINNHIKTKNQSIRLIGKQLQDLKSACENEAMTKSGKEVNIKAFYKYTKDSFQYSRNKTNEFMEIFEEFGTTESLLTEKEMLKIISNRKAQEKALKAKKDELATDKLNKNESATDELTINESTFDESEKKVIIYEQKENIKKTDIEYEEQKRISDIEQLAYYIIRTSKYCWNVDSSAQEIADEIYKQQEQGTIPKLNNLSTKLTRVFKIMNIGE